MRFRIVATCAVMTLLAVACGNAGSDKPVTVTTKPGAPGITQASAADLKKNVTLTGVQGVTDSDINVAVITSKTNLLGGPYGSFADGIKAYFNYMNDGGGIYGRKLNVTANRDDQMLQNQQQVKSSLAQDKAFATFIATPLFTGAPDIAATNPQMPTFIWNINPEMAGHPNIFGTVGALCFNCIGQGSPFLAQQAGVKKVAILGYGVTASSKQCATAQRDSFKKYPSAQVVFFDNQLQFAQADLSADVGQIKEKGAGLIFTCIDAKESLILGKELVKQHVNAVQQLPNGYDQKFVRDNAQYLEGAYVSPQFQAFEYEPQLAEAKLFKEWMQKGNFEVNELSTEGWIAANEFVTGLKYAGPNFSQQKLIDSLNQVTDFRANGMIVPIDWTRQHEDPRGAGGRVKPGASGKYDCGSTVTVHDGKFVPLKTPPGKPWICLTGGDNSPTLTKTPEYMSFAPPSG